MFGLLILHDKVLSSVKRLSLKNELELGKFLMKIRNISCSEIDPCGTPIVFEKKIDLTET